MTDKYKLLPDGIVVPCNDLMGWAQWFETADRSVSQDEVDGVRVSTVFLGLDHSFASEYAAPILFETMIFGGPHDGYQERCATYDQAGEMHKKAMNVAFPSAKEGKPCFP